MNTENLSRSGDVIITPDTPNIIIYLRKSNFNMQITSINGKYYHNPSFGDLETRKGTNRKRICMKNFVNHFSRVHNA